MKKFPDIIPVFPLLKTVYPPYKFSLVMRIPVQNRSAALANTMKCFCSDSFTVANAHVALARSFFILFIRGPGWSPPPMGFGIGILVTGGNL